MCNKFLDQISLKFMYYMICNLIYYCNQHSFQLWRYIDKARLDCVVTKTKSK